VIAFFEGTSLCGLFLPFLAIPPFCCFPLFFFHRYTFLGSVYVPLSPPRNNPHPFFLSFSPRFFCSRSELTPYVPQPSNFFSSSLWFWPDLTVASCCPFSRSINLSPRRFFRTLDFQSFFYIMIFPFFFSSSFMQNFLCGLGCGKPLAQTFSFQTVFFFQSLFFERPPPPNFSSPLDEEFGCDRGAELENHFLHLPPFSLRLFPLPFFLFFEDHCSSTFVRLRRLW